MYLFSESGFCDKKDIVSGSWEHFELRSRPYALLPSAFLSLSSYTLVWGAFSVSASCRPPHPLNSSLRQQRLSLSKTPVVVSINIQRPLLRHLSMFNAHLSSAYCCGSPSSFSPLLQEPVYVKSPPPPLSFPRYTSSSILKQPVAETCQDLTLLLQQSVNVQTTPPIPAAVLCHGLAPVSGVREGAAADPAGQAGPLLLAGLRRLAPGRLPVRGRCQPVRHHPCRGAPPLLLRYAAAWHADPHRALRPTLQEGEFSFLPIRIARLARSSVV